MKTQVMVSIFLINNTFKNKNIYFFIHNAKVHLTDYSIV